MSVLAAAIIFAIAVVLSLVLAAPLIFWLRRRRRRIDPTSTSSPPGTISWFQAAPGLVAVAILAAAFASEYVAPDGWLGQRVANTDGKFWLFLLVMIPVFLIERTFFPRFLAWRERRRRRSSRAP